MADSMDVEIHLLGRGLPSCENTITIALSEVAGLLEEHGVLLDSAHVKMMEVIDDAE